MGIRVAFVSGLRIFPPTSGGTLRSSQLVSCMAQGGCSVSVYSLVGRKEDYSGTNLRRGKSITENKMGVVETTYVELLPAIVQKLFYYFEWPPLWLQAYLKLKSKRFLKELEPFDVVIFDFPYTFLEGVKAPVTAVNLHNVESDLASSPSLKKKVKDLETRVVEKVDQVLFCSSQDEAWFKNEAKITNGFLIPNGVDRGRFSTEPSSKIEARKSLGLKEQDYIILFPASSYGPNQEGFAFLQDFCARNEDVLTQKGIRFLVVGSVSSKLFETPTMTVTSKVEDIDPYFAAADAGINPVFSGSGTNVKMAEFAFSKLLVLTTLFGTRGLEFNDKVHGLIFEEAKLIDTLNAALELSDKQRQSLSEALVRDNEKYFDMEKSVSELVAGWKTKVLSES